MRPLDDSWYDPRRATEATYSDIQAALCGIVSASLCAMEELEEEERPGIRRRIERRIDDLRGVGSLLQSLLRSEER